MDCIDPGVRAQNGWIWADETKGLFRLEYLHLLYKIDIAKNEGVLFTYFVETGRLMARAPNGKPK